MTFIDTGGAGGVEALHREPQSLDALGNREPWCLLQQGEFNRRHKIMLEDDACRLAVAILPNLDPFPGRLRLATDATELQSPDCSRR